MSSSVGGGLSLRPPLRPHDQRLQGDQQVAAQGRERLAARIDRVAKTAIGFALLGVGAREILAKDPRALRPAA